MNIFTGLQVPKVIFETHSKYNGHIKVVDFGNTRRIRVDNIEQSISHNSPNCSRLYWGKVISIMKENRENPSEVLLLGVGGGTLIHLISKNFPSAHITGVEIDPAMLEIARDYFNLGSVPNQRIIVDDAMRVVVEPEKYNISNYTFDVMIVDIYIGEKYPELGRSGNFIAAVKRLVKPGGLVIFNRIYKEDHQDEVNIFIDYVSEFFDNVKNLVVAGYTNSDNVLIYARV